MLPLVAQCNTYTKVSTKISWLWNVSGPMDRHYCHGLTISTHPSLVTWCLVTKTKDTLTHYSGHIFGQFYGWGFTRYSSQLICIEINPFPHQDQILNSFRAVQTWTEMKCQLCQITVGSNIMVCNFKLKPGFSNAWHKDVKQWLREKTFEVCLLDIFSSLPDPWLDILKSCQTCPNVRHIRIHRWRGFLERCEEFLSFWIVMNIHRVVHVVYIHMMTFCLGSMIRDWMRFRNYSQ